MKEFFAACNTQHGRWNRKKFWLYPIGMSIILWLLMFLILTISSSSNTILLTSLPIGWYLFYVQITSYAKRLRDLDKSPWLLILMFIPFINIGLLIYCGFFKGTQGANRFGPDPLGGTADIPKEKQETVEL